MLFFVALGHTLELYISNGGFELYLMKYIYLFHMPMFAFVTGYFSKNLDKSRDFAVEKCLIPYVLLQGTYIIVANLLIYFGIAKFNKSVFNSSLLLPSSAFYYLLAVFFWKFFSKDFFKLRFPLFASIMFGVIISFTTQNEFHRGLGAVFSLLCFFVMGVMCNENFIDKIRKIPHVISIVILLLGILPAVYLPYAIHSVRLTYSAAGFGMIEGSLYRITFYAIATVMGVAIINLVSKKKIILSKVGEASLLVYAGSTFLAPHAYLLIANTLNLPANRIGNMIGMLVFCVGVLSICSIPLFQKYFQSVIDFINRILFRTHK